MKDLMRFENNEQERYEEYEDLLCRRDQLTKEAASILICFTKEFGEKIAYNFELKIDCIKKKKAIAYCQARINRGENIDLFHMNAVIDQDMTLYYEELREMLEQNESAKKSKTSGSFHVERAKKIYRRLAKMLHPDINKKTMECEKLRELWERIVVAYHMNDDDELEDLEVLVGRTMEDLGEEGFEVSFSDIEDRISRVERQINEILTTQPYTYNDLLCSEEMKAAKHKELDGERDEYQKYLVTLTATLDQMIGNGGVSIRWTMN